MEETIKMLFWQKERNRVTVGIYIYNMEYTPAEEKNKNTREVMKQRCSVFRRKNVKEKKGVLALKKKSINPELHLLYLFTKENLANQ